MTPHNCVVSAFDVAAGYSGTPLAKKLGIKSGLALCLVDAPAGWSIPALPDDVIAVQAIGNADVIVAFCRTMADVEKLASSAKLVAAGASLWISWPRKAGGHVSDVTENLLRDKLLPLGVVDVKVAALDDDWSGLKFVWRKEKRPRQA